MNPRPVLQHYADIFQPTQSASPHVGGLSGSQIWRLHSQAGELCLRQWPAEHPNRERLAWIHALLRHVQARGLDVVPAPLPTRDGGTCVAHEGHFWELAPWMPGQAVEPEAATVEHVAAATAVLAEFHAAAATFEDVETRSGPAPAVTERLERIERWLHEGGAVAMERAAAHCDATLAQRARPLIAALRLHGPSVKTELLALQQQPVALQPCIRDVHDQHVLFVHDQTGKPRVSGLIDFGALRVDAVATDLARLLGAMAGDNPALREAGLAAYQRQRKLSDLELRMAQSIDQANVVLTGPQWLDWLLIEQKWFPSLPAILARLDRILSRLKNLQDSAAVERKTSRNGLG